MKTQSYNEETENIFVEKGTDWNSPERKKLEYEMEIKWILNQYGIDLNKCDY